MNIYLYSSQDIMHFGGGGTSSRVTYEHLKKAGHVVKFFNTFEGLKDAIRKNRPDIVLHHNLVNLISVGKFCFKQKIPFVPTINGLFTCGKGTHIVGGGFGKSCCNCSLVGMLRCSWLNHYKMRFGIARRLQLILSAPYRYWRIKRRVDILNKATAVIVIGYKMKEIMERNGVSSKMYVVPQPIDDEFSDGESSEKKVVFFASGLDTTKGALVLLEAFKRAELSDYKLVSVAQIYSIIKMSDFNKFLGSDVQLLGQVSLLEMKKLIYSCSIVAFPSLLFEPYGRVWAEAACAGKPIIGIRGRGGVGDYLVHNESCYLVEPDMNSLVTGLQKLANDDSLRVRLGINAKRYAKENLIGSIVAAKLERIYKKILEY